MKIIEAFIYESNNLSNSPWGAVNKKELMQYVIQHPNLADKIYIKIEKNWQEDPKNRLKYPIADKHGNIYRYGLSTALAYAKANNETEVIKKINKLYKKFGINEAYQIDKQTGYYDTSSIHKLFHWVKDDMSMQYVLKNGIKADDNGYVYLSEKPLYNKVSFSFGYTSVSICSSNSLKSECTGT